MLADPSKPLNEPLKIRVSAPFNLLDEDTPAQLIPALATFLDEYFQEFRPRDLVRETPPSSNAGSQTTKSEACQKSVGATAQGISTELPYTVTSQAPTGKYPETMKCLQPIGRELSIGT